VTKKATKPAAKKAKKRASKKAAAPFDPNVYVAGLKHIPGEDCSKKPTAPTMSFYDFCAAAWARIYKRYGLDDEGAIPSEHVGIWREAWRAGEDPEHFGGCYVEDCFDLEPLGWWDGPMSGEPSSPVPFDWMKPPKPAPEPEPSGPTMSFYDWVDIAWTAIYQGYALDDTGCVVADAKVWLEAWRAGEDPESFGDRYAQDYCDLHVLDTWPIQSYEDCKSPTKLRFPGVNPKWKKRTSAEPAPPAPEPAPQPASIHRQRTPKAAKAAPPQRPTPPSLDAVQLELFGK
jgi:hypothetical protein